MYTAVALLDVLLYSQCFYKFINILFNSIELLCKFECQMNKTTILTQFKYNKYIKVKIKQKIIDFNITILTSSDKTILNDVKMTEYFRRN